MIATELEVLAKWLSSINKEKDELENKANSFIKRIREIHECEGMKPTKEKVPKEPAEKRFNKCLQWFWLFQDANEVFGMYFDDDGPPILEEGYEEAECISDEAWRRFEEAASALRKGLKYV